MKTKKQKKKSRSKGLKRVHFRLKTEKGKDVYLSGSFNDWNSGAKKMRDDKRNGNYSAIVYLAPGKYEYKFLIDNEWHVDPECPDWIVNAYGTLNSVIDVENSGNHGHRNNS